MMNVDILNPWISYVAAFCTTAAFVPQVIEVVKTNDTSGISLGMYAIFCLGVICWLLYGVVLKDVAMIVANTVTLALAITVMTYVIKNKLG